jgi:hypothetical protein
MLATKTIAPIPPTLGPMRHCTRACQQYHHNVSYMQTRRQSDNTAAGMTCYSMEERYRKRQKCPSSDARVSVAACWCCRICKRTCALAAPERRARTREKHERRARARAGERRASAFCGRQARDTRAPQHKKTAQLAPVLHRNTVIPQYRNTSRHTVTSEHKVLTCMRAQVLVHECSRQREKCTSSSS